MSLLEVLERQIILGNLAQIHNEFAWNAELDTSSQSFLMPLEYHIHQYFELGGSLL